ncbi:uncharacterized protein LOC124149457 [Haliotis rufescens]|uniref:uncharacterized protein LOC124149457 n=1 Tax=Haliotis rufescens TaxID=6454 RepID=UPI00201E9111|nr:uncharacterized protein LOC124149457 [Haliotis rufescens]
MGTMVLVLFLCIAGVSAYSPLPDDVSTNRTEWIATNRAATSFRHKYVTHNGGINDHTFSTLPYITITATNHVSDAALHKAALDVSFMVRNMPDDVFNGIAKSHGVGIFSKSEGMVVFPENAHLADTAACRGRCDGGCSHTCTVDHRKWSTIAGLTNQRSSVLDDNVLCDSADQYHHQENLVVHEFGHLTMKYMPKHWNAKILAAYSNAHSHRLWILSHYGMVNADEYWAEATASFFMAIIRTDVSAGMNLCGTSRPCSSEAAARDYLKRHDPRLYEVLEYAYTNNRPQIRSGLKPCI